MDEPIKTKKFPFLLAFAFVLVFGIGLFYAYYITQNKHVTDQIAQIEREITQANKQFEETRSTETVSAQRGVIILEKVTKEEVIWSDVLSLLQKMVPLDLVEKKPLVEFTSYTGSEGGGLTFNGHTNPSTNVKKQFNAIADTIQIFNENPEFKNAFVPSISKSVTQDNETILTFIFNVDYDESASSASLTDASAETSSPDGVLRK